MTPILNSVLLAAPPPAGGGQGFSMLIMMGLFIVVIYFFMIRPQQKRQKELRNFQSSLKSGDKVITSGGIYGRIAEVNETTVILEVEGKMRIKVDKSVLIRDPSDLQQVAK
jgi:preprotein translocase subunit YajC